MVAAYLGLVACSLVEDSCAGSIAKHCRYTDSVNSFSVHSRVFVVRKCRNCEGRDTFPNYRLFLRQMK